MVETQLNMFDTVVLVVVGLSMLISLFRGFIKEFLSLFAWFGAGIITLYGFDDISQMLAPHFSNKYVAAGIASLGTYIAVFICISILNSIIIQYLKSGAEVGFLDKLLGLGFGGLRGAFIVSLAYLTMSFFWNENNQPEWVQQAKTREYVEMGARTLANVAPQYIAEFRDMAEGAADSAGATTKDAAGNVVEGSRDMFDGSDISDMKNDLKKEFRDTTRDAQKELRDGIRDGQREMNRAVKDVQKSITQ